MVEISRFKKGMIVNMEHIEELKNKLDYIGLDLDNIPEILTNYKPLNFRPNPNYDNTIHKVYRYVPISKIQILISDTNRLDREKEKYEKADYLSAYLIPDREETC